jgi:Myb/SANT-like DNA-binding domain
MAPKRVKSKRKSSKDIDDIDDLMVDELSQQSQQSKSSQRSRAKKYSKDETDMLVKICLDYEPIISKNSNSDADKKIKAKAWEKIKCSFDTRCRSEGIYVSIYT